MGPKIEERWINYFRDPGYPEASGISTGMEGAVYSLRDKELVAKVWVNRTEQDLRILQEFYRSLGNDGSIKTPKIVDVLIIDDTLVSHEQYLSGKPLENFVNEQSENAELNAAESVCVVLEHLRDVEVQSGMYGLRVLDEPKLPWEGQSTWSEAIGELIDTRLSRFGDQLTSRVPNLSDIVAALSDFLKTRDGVRMSILHGDLCGPNIMVANDLKPLSVFDFGFLTLVGDPALDASISSAIFNMYGPHARDIDDEVTDFFSRRLGHSIQTLLAYRAVYGCLTSNAYALDGSDGHFEWCVTMLNRADVQTALGL